MAQLVMHVPKCASLAIQSSSGKQIDPGLKRLLIPPNHGPSKKVVVSELSGMRMLELH